MSALTYRPMKAGESGEVLSLVMCVFDEFIGNEWSAEGSATLREIFTPQALSERQGQGDFIWITLDSNRIVGMIGQKPAGHVWLLFVERQYHGMGIGTQLFRTAFAPDICEAHNTVMIDVDASRYATPFYRKLGFRETAPEQVHRGMRYFPMELDLSL